MTIRAFWQTTYSSLVLPTFYIVLKFAAFKNLKLKETLAGYNDLWQRLEKQIANRNTQIPLIWFHVASAGEFLQALPVMQRLMADGYQCALTITSVSGIRWANKQRAQYPNLILVDYFPLDTKRNVNRLLDIIKPNAIIFVAYDLWPNLIWEACKRKLPLFLISAILNEKSKRISSYIARSFYKHIYPCLTAIFTVSEQDKKRFEKTCASLQHISIVGDTRIDSVLDRKKQISPPKLPDYVKDRTVILLGSVWPSDEYHIFPVLQEALNRFPDLLLIVAPHETDNEHIQFIEKTFKDFKQTRFTSLQNEVEEKRLIIVDTVGHLSSLYYYADLAYVGGAFGSGVHNTIEPCAMGLPAIFGPFFQNSPEAINLVKEKTCFSIKNKQEFSSILYKLLEDPEYRKKTGFEAARYVENHAGASELIYLKIKDAIS